MLRYLIGCALACVSLQAVASVDLKEAEKKFQARRLNEANIEEARKIFMEALPGATGETKLYVMDRIGRLAYYQGSWKVQTEPAKMDALADECLNAVETISPANYGEKKPEYYYWKSICKAVKAQAKRVQGDYIYILKNSAGFRKSLEEGLKEVSARYEGGGFYRLLGVMYAELPPVNPFDPGPNGTHQDLAKAHENLDNAIKSPAYESASDPDKSTGVYFYPVYLYKAKAYAAGGNKPAAIQVLADAIKRIKAGDVSDEQVPESEIALMMMEQYKKDLEG